MEKLVIRTERVSILVPDTGTAEMPWKLLAAVQRLFDAAKIQVSDDLA